MCWTMPPTAGRRTPRIVYEDMKAVEQEYALHCGLQQLFTQADGCAVPGYRTDSGYDFYLLAKDAPARRVSGLPAQLAAVLCGQADTFFSAYHDGQALCKSEVNVMRTVEGIRRAAASAGLYAAIPGRCG